MITKFLRSMLVLPLLMVFGMVGASADTAATGSNMTITVPASTTLIARVAVAVTVQVKCTAPDLSQYTIFYPPTVFFNTGTVTVSQAFGTSVNNARGEFAPVICDGNTDPYTVYLTATTVPFHPGPAAIFATASWTEQWGGCLNAAPYTCSYFSVTDSASVQGPLTLSN
jgi:hypothetical protein